jgi:acetyltransferase-like isoleucine patch superfamily enzyme
MVLTLGNHSYSHRYTESGDLPDKKTTVGSYTSINSMDVKGWASYGHGVGPISTYPFGYHARHLTDPDLFHRVSSEKVAKLNRHTIIGNDVWIGENVTIKCGVKIGDGVIIGFNSNVTKDVEPYCVVGGNPARVLKKRFSDDIIHKLLKIQWWTWPEDKIKENSKMFIEGDIQEFVDTFYISD